MNISFNIVICDDDPYFADELQKKVIDIAAKLRLHCNITLLYDGKELIDHCRQNISDIILTDIDMPNIDGFQAIQTLQQQQSDLAVIFITAHEEFALLFWVIFLITP